ncbi:MAG: ribosome rescue protein RqcH [Sulfolobales archaeon]|nr:NFACT family protein [Ignisphaera sp.]MCX8199755.1 ribosome rescue protein RqcH [Sulfolobales archaeon]MDW8085007.1 ribosome rescue protein RqcH [Ignisphaera sp.]
MSWLDIKVWLREVAEKLVGSYIDDIYVLDKLLIFKLKNVKHSEEFLLITEPGRRISIAKLALRLKEDYVKSSSVWKSSLRNCSIINVEQPDCERIIFINLKCREETRKVVIELLPRGVVAILDDDNTILLVSSYRKMKDRSLIPKSKYMLPPKGRNLDYYNVSVENLKNIVLNGHNVVLSLIKSLDIPPELADTINLLCKLGNKEVSSLNEMDYECIAVKLRELLLTTMERPTPCIVYKNSSMVGFYPFIPARFYGDEYRVEYMQSFNDTVEKYFSESFKSLLISKKIETTANELERLKKSLEVIDKNLVELRRRKEYFENLMKMVNEFYAELERIHECVRSMVKSSAWKHVESCSNFIADLKPDKGLYKVSISGLELEVDVRKSFAENYFALLKFLSDISRSIKRALEERNNIEIKINELNSIIKDETKIIELKLSKKIEWYEKFHWMISSEGFLIIGGKDASQNNKLIKRYLKDNDIVLHADVHGASTVIIKTSDRNVDEKTLKEAAEFAASYSKAWKAGLTSIDVFWVYGSQISLKPPSGEYLPKGAFMVYGKKNYISNVKLMLAVGVESIDTEDGNKAIVRAIAGPEEVIKRRAHAYMVLVPGSENPYSIAKTFLENLKRVLKNYVITVDVKDIELKIPGRSKIIKLVMPS